MSEQILASEKSEKVTVNNIFDYQHFREQFRAGGVCRVSKMAEELIFFLIPIDSCPTKQNPLSNQFFRLWKLEKSEVEHVNKEQKKYLSAIIITYIKRAFCCSTKLMHRMVDQHLSTFSITL